MANEARNAELAITISYYPRLLRRVQITRETSTNIFICIIVLLKRQNELQYLSSPAVFVDAYRPRYLWSMVYEVIYHCLLTN